MARLPGRLWIEDEENPYYADDGDHEELEDDDLDDEDEDFDEDFDEEDEDLEEDDSEDEDEDEDEQPPEHARGGTNL